MFDAGRLEDPLEAFERAANCDPALARTQSRLAAHLSSIGKLDRVEHLFRRSLALDPNHVAGWLGLGRLLEDVGDADGALACYRNVLELEPGHAAALGHYLALVRAAAPAELLAAAETTTEDPRAADEPRALVAYGLAKYYDRRSEHGAAARVATAANAARRRSARPFDRASLTARVSALIGSYDASFFADRRDFGVGTEQPVFIVGMPRSGTTLVEQILAAHPMLHGAGELQDLSRLAAETAGKRSESRMRAAAHLEVAESRALACRYLRALRDGAPKDSLRISDKSPLNFYQLPLVALLFPNASVVHCQRDPRDNALSIWMENFNAEQRYATDFHDLAHYFAEYQRLVAHWQSVLPLHLLEVQYEDTVANVEHQARRVVEFLGVPWNARCLDFHGSGRAVQTLSRWQVRQPIYSSSVGRWRRYMPHLPELQAAFGGPGDAQ